MSLVSLFTFFNFGDALWITFSLIRLLGVFSGGSVPTKATEISNPEMQNEAPPLIVVSTGV